MTGKKQTQPTLEEQYIELFKRQYGHSVTETNDDSTSLEQPHTDEIVDSCSSNTTIKSC